jgi:hypothetical protein
MVQSNHPFMSNRPQDALPEELVQERLGLIESSQDNIRIVPQKKTLDPYEYIDFLDGAPAMVNKQRPSRAADAELEALKRRSAERARLHMTGNALNSRAGTRDPLLDPSVRERR